jgi:predicted  nucleic acid-binding Zn-ribbon protein
MIPGAAKPGLLPFFEPKYVAMYQLVIGVITIVLTVIGAISKAFYDLLKEIRNELKTMNATVVKQDVEITTIKDTVVDHEGRIRTLERRPEK